MGFGCEKVAFGGLAFGDGNDRRMFEKEDGGWLLLVEDSIVEVDLQAVRFLVLNAA